MDNAVWYILAVLILGWTGFCVFRWLKNRKKGGCSDGCSGCPYSSGCSRKK